MLAVVSFTYSLSPLVNKKEKAPWQMNNHERIEAAGRKKEEGNLLFKSGKHKRAAKKYDKVINQHCLWVFLLFSLLLLTLKVTHYVVLLGCGIY